MSTFLLSWRLWCDLAMQRSAQPPPPQPILTAQPALPASPRVPSPPAQRDELVAYKEAVVDLVIEAVDKLIDASGAQGSGSAAQLKDTFAPRRVQTVCRAPLHT